MSRQINRQIDKSRIKLYNVEKKDDTASLSTFLSVYKPSSSSSSRLPTPSSFSRPLTALPRQLTHTQHTDKHKHPSSPAPPSTPAYSHCTLPVLTLIFLHLRVLAVYLSSTLPIFLALFSFPIQTFHESANVYKLPFFYGGEV